MQFKNLTKHDINIKTFSPADPIEKFFLIIHPSGEEAIVEMKYSDMDYQMADIHVVKPAPQLGIQTVNASVGRVIGLPEPQEDVCYIVSAMVAQAVPERTDVYAPDTGDTAIRDKKGNITQVTRLVQYVSPYEDKVQQLEQDIQDRGDAEMRHEEYRQQKEAERVHYANLANEIVDREMQHLTEKNMDLQDEIVNKDHQWGTSRK